MNIYGIIPITPYKVRYWINADLTTSLLTFPFTLVAIFMSQISPDICLHPLNGANHAENMGACFRNVPQVALQVAFS